MQRRCALGALDRLRLERPPRRTDLCILDPTGEQTPKTRPRLRARILPEPPPAGTARCSVFLIAPSQRFLSAGQTPPLRAPLSIPPPPAPLPTSPPRVDPPIQSHANLQTPQREQNRTEAGLASLIPRVCHSCPTRRAEVPPLDHRLDRDTDASEESGADSPRLASRRDAGGWHQARHGAEVEPVDGSRRAAHAGCLGDEGHGGQLVGCSHFGPNT